jgi:hypothetical protein
VLHAAVSVEAPRVAGDAGEVVEEVLEEPALPFGPDEDLVRAALDALEPFDVARFVQGYFSVTVPGSGSSFTTNRFWISS